MVVGRAANPELLRRLSLGAARAFAAVTNEDLANLESAMTARSLNPDLRVVLRAGDGRAEMLLPGGERETSPLEVAR